MGGLLTPWCSNLWWSHPSGWAVPTLCAGSLGLHFCRCRSVETQWHRAHQWKWLQAPSPLLTWRHPGQFSPHRLWTNSRVRRLNCVSGEARITITSYKKTGVGGGSNGCRDWGWTRNQAENPGSGWIGISVPLKPHKFWIPLKCFCIPNPGGFWLSLKVEESSHHLFLANSSQPTPLPTK